jgi:hypothetical protein
MGGPPDLLLDDELITSYRKNLDGYEMSFIRSV